MFRPYREILARPGALSFSAAGLVARLPISMVGIGIVLMVSELYGSYGMAGRVSAVFVVVQAICAPQLAKLIDRRGQAAVMRPALAVACTGLTALVLAAVAGAPEWALYLAAAVAASSIGSMGALVRARWGALLGTPRDLHTAYSLESALDEVAFIVGPVLATTLATAVAPWSALVVPILAAFVGGYWFLAQRATEPPPAPREPGVRTGTILSGSMVAVAGVFAAVGAIFGGIDVAVVAFAEEEGSKGAAGFVLAVFALGSLAAGLAYGARHWRSPLWARFTVGTCVLAAGVSTFFLVGSLPVLAVAGFVAGLAIAPTIITGNALVQAVVPPQRLTEGLTWLTAAMGIGVSVGSTGAGTAIDAYGSRGGFTAVAVAGAAAVLASLAGGPALRARTRAEEVRVPSAAEPPGAA
ncbi:MFS transporter [Georgenia faecalis]|uniref:MFS transporter n=1 Tax=Georgenia faecalis TaxID=2483799 RepID=A0ABV9D612_9MICO|nr:MFS transporter [Georgenia faecalis]